jgi:hypothetical protein
MLRGATTIYEADITCTSFLDGSGVNYAHVIKSIFAFNISDTPGSGTFTYSLQFARVATLGSFFTAEVYNRSILLLETKK